MARELRFPARDLIVGEDALGAFDLLRAAVRCGVGAGEVAETIVAAVDAIAVQWPAADAVTHDVMFLNATVQQAHEAGQISDTIAAATATLTSVVVGPWITAMLDRGQLRARGAAASRARLPSTRAGSRCRPG